MHLKNYILSLHHLNRLKSELNEIYANKVLRTLSLSLIGIFVPVYLFSLGFSIQTILIYVFIEYVISLVLSPFLGSFSSKIGLKHSITVATLFYFVYFIMLIFVTSQSSVQFLYSISALFGFANALYWIGIHGEFVRYSDKLKEGKQSGNSIGFPAFASVMSPIIGGFILTTFGYIHLSAIVILIMITSVTPLFLTSDYKKSFKFKVKETKVLLNKNLVPTYFLWGVTTLFIAIIWPLFIYTQLTDFTGLGVATTVSGFAAALFILFVGRLSDRVNSSKLVKIGAILYALIWFHRPFISGPIEIMISSFLSGLFFTLINVPLYSSFCKFSKKNIMVGVVFREIWLNAGRVVAAVILIIFSFYLGAEHLFNASFILAGLLALLLLPFKTE